MNDLPMASSPGKFEGELRIAELLYEQGNFDDETGIIQDTGWYGLILDPLSALEGLELTPAEARFLNDLAGVILYENDLGFVSATYYHTKDQVNKAWDEVQFTEEEEQS